MKPANCVHYVQANAVVNLDREILGLSKSKHGLGVTFYTGMPKEVRHSLTTSFTDTLSVGTFTHLEHIKTEFNQTLCSDF